MASTILPHGEHALDALTELPTRDLLLSLDFGPPMRHHTNRFFPNA